MNSVGILKYPINKLILIYTIIQKKKKISMVFTQFIDNKAEKTTRFNTVPKDTVNSYAFIIISTYASETFLSISIQISNQFRSIHADDLLIVVKACVEPTRHFRKN